MMKLIPKTIAIAFLAYMGLFNAPGVSAQKAKAKKQVKAKPAIKPNDASTAPEPKAERQTTATKAEAAVADASGLTLPVGFVAIVLAKDLGRARHITVANTGDIYVKLERVRNNGGIIKLSDKNKDGKIDDTSRFGNYGGTGIAFKNGYLYASSNSDVFRYKLNANNEVENPNNPETIITGLLDRR